MMDWSVKGSTRLLASNVCVEDSAREELSV